MYSPNYSNKSIQRNTENNKIITKFYKENLGAVKQILKEIGEGKGVNLKLVGAVVKDVIKLKETRNIIKCLHTTLKTKDYYTYTHSLNVAMLCYTMGQWLRYPKDKLIELVYSGLLHDIGKAKIPDNILNKPDKLKEEEFEEIKQHPRYGYDILRPLKTVSLNVKMAVLMHHEKENGTGYPMGVKSERIHPYAKIVSVCDIYDAMTSDRVYRKKRTPFQVLRLFEVGTFGLLDINYTRIMLSNIANYYVGDEVVLSNGEIGRIVFIHPSDVSNPVVRVEQDFIDLAERKDIKIVELNHNHRN